MDIFDISKKFGTTQLDFVIEHVNNSKAEFKRLQDHTDSLLNTTLQDLAEILSPNKKWFDKNTIYQQSIFLYLSLSHREDVISRARKIQKKCLELLAENKFCCAPANDVHVTIFTEIIDEDVQISENDVLDVYEKYETLIEKTEPLFVHVLGPKITPDGGVILECQVYSESFYKLREYAITTINYLGTTPRVPTITYASIGYILETDIHRLTQLHSALRDLSAKFNDISVFIDKLNVIKTLNKGLINPIVSAKLKYSVRENGIDSQLIKELHALSERSIDVNIRNLIAEEIQRIKVYSELI